MRDLEPLFHHVQRCKKCNGADLTFLSKGNQYLGDFGDLYRCETCGLTTDSLKIIKKEYSEKEYDEAAYKLAIKINDNIDRLNYYLLKSKSNMHFEKLRY